MQQASSNISLPQSKPIPIPAPSKKTSPEPRPFVLEAGSPALSDCESALDEDENAFDLYHLPSHHRRNALSFENGFEFPAFLHGRVMGCFIWVG
ncbi:hypothetical protein GGR53DRAFT_461639 [Hypoxylon sp. FL1150]|nr:hypothetical protein GGR53DRAFT_461639 [Hypoxylon sp. FL1150]